MQHISVGINIFRTQRHA